MARTKTPVIAKQDTFNKVYRGLARQGFEHSIEGTGCVYRNKDGLACAAGQLIPSKLYDPRIEKGIVLEQIPEYTIEPSIRVTKLIKKLGHDLQLVHELQDIHDTSNDAVDMKRRLESYAKNNGLKIPRIYPSRASSAAGRCAA